MSNMKKTGTTMTLYLKASNAQYPINTEKITWDDRFSEFDDREMSEYQKNQTSIEIGEFAGVDHSIYQCPKDTTVRWAEKGSRERRSYTLTTGR